MRTVLILARSCRSCCRKNVNFKIPVLAPIFLRQFTLSVPLVISATNAPCGQCRWERGRGPIEGGNSVKYSAPVDWNILLTVDWCGFTRTPDAGGSWALDPQPPLVGQGPSSYSSPYALQRLPLEADASNPSIHESCPAINIVSSLRWSGIGAPWKFLRWGFWHHL